MTYSAAAQVIIAVIPIVGIVIGGQVVFFYLLWRHKQITLMIKNNSFKPTHFDIKIFAVLTGLLLTVLGFVLTVFFGLFNGLSYVLLGGLIPGALGVALLLFYKMYPQNTQKN